MNNEIITYMKLGKKIMNGWKIVKVGNKYNVYTYTTCKKLGNWQIFFSGYTYDFLKNYFLYGVKELNYQIANKLEDIKNQYSKNMYLHTKEWLEEELKWRNETCELFSAFENVA